MIDDEFIEIIGHWQQNRAAEILDSKPGDAPSKNQNEVAVEDVLFSHRTRPEEYGR